FKNNKPHPWSKDVSSFIVYPEAANQTIYSPRLEENDIGNYSCILRNETHAIKHEIELRLQDKLDNPMPTFRPKDLMVSVGESARFYCEAFVGNLYLPDATNEIVWSQMFDDHPHNVSDSMQVNVTREEGQIIGSYLSIPNIQAHHYGRYRCQIVSGNSAQKLNLSVLLSPVEVTAITDTQLSVLVYVMATLLLVLVILFAWICRTVQQRTSSSKKDNRCSAQFIANNEHESNCLNGVLPAQSVHITKTSNPVQLDSSHMGHEVVIIKNGLRACGTGGVLANAPLVQSKSYFEVKLQQSGHWSIGLATQQTDLNQSVGGKDRESWCLNSNHLVLHGGDVIYRLDASKSGTVPNGGQNSPGHTVPGTVPVDLTPVSAPVFPSAPGTAGGTESGLPQEGDTIGVAYDHVELNFYLNGKNLNVPVLNVRGTVHPCLFVDDGAILDIVLDNFAYGPPPGFERILVEQSLL
uniref:Ig-like domain-containing protein n=1 Tax=Anopheles christyi TaxID=43041 RepID=A0A182KCF5_9DIPT